MCFHFPKIIILIFRLKKLQMINTTKTKTDLRKTSMIFKGLKMYRKRTYIKTVLCLLILLQFSLIQFSYLSVSATDIIARSTSLRQTYRQNEKIEITATIVNNDTRVLTVEKFNITIIFAEKIGGSERKAKVYEKNIENVQLNYHEALSILVEISLSDLAPDTYNISASFLCYYDPLHERVVFVIENFKFRLLPYIEIPPAAIFIAVVMSAIIIVYIGYGIAGKFARSRRKK